MNFVLFLFLMVAGPGPHTDITATSATFKNRAACEQRLAAEIESAPSGVLVWGSCGPTKVKAPKR